MCGVTQQTTTAATTIAEVTTTAATTRIKELDSKPIPRLEIALCFLSLVLPSPLDRE